MGKARAVWIFLAVAPLVRAIQWAEGPHHWDALEFLLGIMLALGFPTTAPVLGALALGTIALRRFGVDVAGTRLTFVAGWAFMIVAGYLQWFVLVPRVVAWLREPGPQPEPSEPGQGAS